MSSDLLREAQDPSTTPARLLELAQASRETWTAIAVHPQAYPGLLDWLKTHGDDTVKAAIASRDAVQLPPPPAPPADFTPIQQIPTPPAPPAPETPTVEAPAAQTQAFPPPPATPTASATPASAAAPANGGAQNGNGNNNAAKTLGVLALIAVLVGGGFFAVQALTDDEKKTEQNTINIDADGIDTDGTDTDGIDTDGVDIDGGEGGISGATGSNSAFCQQWDKTTNFDTSTGNASAFDEMAQRFEELAAASPAEVKEDAELVARYYRSMAELMSGSTSGSYNSEDGEGWADALVNLTQYGYMNCDF